MINLLPHNQNFPNRKSDVTIQERYKNRHYTWVESGKAAIKNVIEYLGINRKDEIFISTTSDSSFVSTCVSVTCFNHCGISRIITPRTKLIIIIHEFGFENSNTCELLKFAQTNNIFVLEDHAHTIFGKNRFGNFFGLNADFCITSLPKSTSLSTGAILSSKKRCFEKHEIDETKIQNESNYSTLRRNQVYRQWQRILPEVDEVFEFRRFTDPFMFTFYSNRYKEIYELLDTVGSGVEMGRTYNPNWVSLPCSPFSELSEMKEVAHKIEFVHGRS